MDNENPTIDPEYLKHLYDEYRNIQDEYRKLYLGEWESSKEYHAIRHLRSQLAPRQLEAFDHVRWLYHGGRAAGRSYLVATVAVCEALDHPDTRIMVVDHHGSTVPDQRRYIGELLMMVIGNLEPEIQDRFEIFARPSVSVRYNSREYKHKD